MNYPQVRACLEALAQRTDQATDIDEVLQAIADAAQVSLGDVDHVGVSVTHRQQRYVTRVWTDDVVIDLDALQRELGEGPCIDVVDSDVDTQVLRGDNIGADPRWPRYGPRAAAAGLRSQLGVRLGSGRSLLGALNLYSTSSDSISADSEALAQLLAIQAGIVLGRVVSEQDLRAALHTRTLIGQATGVVMERYGLSADRGFEYLIRVSQATNVKLRDVAAEIVRGPETPSSDPGQQGAAHSD